MEDMGKEEVWLSSILRENTVLHHKTSMEYFKEFTKLTPKELLSLRQKEGRQFNGRIFQFWKWMQKEKKLSESSSSSYVFGICSFFSFFDLGLKLKKLIPDVSYESGDICSFS
jgi:hypothetical protein